MAHFAEIDSTNLVVRVLVTDNNLPNEGLDWLNDNLGGVWIKTSYNNNIRKRFAGIGFSYDLARDAFISPRPYQSWSLNSEADWQAPKLLPTDGKQYVWNESTLSWVEITGE